jgi:hypothetical protein
VPGPAAVLETIKVEVLDAHAVERRGRHRRTPAPASPGQSGDDVAEAVFSLVAAF